MRKGYQFEIGHVQDSTSQKWSFCQLIQRWVVALWCWLVG